MNVIVSSSLDIPPEKNISLLSNSSSLNLVPTFGCNTHPDPLPPLMLLILLYQYQNHEDQPILVGQNRL